jgi:hypothetical protein
MIRPLVPALFTLINILSIGALLYGQSYHSKSHTGNIIIPFTDKYFKLVHVFDGGSFIIQLPAKIRIIEKDLLTIGNEAFLEISHFKAFSSGKPSGSVSADKFKKQFTKNLRRNRGIIIDEPSQIKQGIEWIFLSSFNHSTLGEVYAYNFVVRHFSGRTLFKLIFKYIPPGGWNNEWVEDFVNAMQLHYQEPVIQALMANANISSSVKSMDINEKEYSLDEKHKDWTLFSLNEHGLIWNFEQSKFSPDCYIHEYYDSSGTELSDFVGKWMETAFGIIADPYNIQLNEMGLVEKFEFKEGEITYKKARNQAFNFYYFITPCQGKIKGYFLNCRNCDCLEGVEYFKRHSSNWVCD